MAKQPATPDNGDDETSSDASASVTKAEGKVRWYQTANAAERTAKARKKPKKNPSPK